MITAQDVRDRLTLFLAGAETLSSFASWLGRESSSLSLREGDALDFADQVLTPIESHFDGLLSQDQLVSELRALL